MKRSAASVTPTPPSKGPSTPQNTTAFGPPRVAPGVTHPAALNYAAGAAQRHVGPPRYAAPVAGGPTPPIPRLDQPADEGLTMADQAVARRAAAGPPPPAGPAPKGAMFSGGPPPAMPQAPGLSRPPQNILPGDILPNEARKDPNFREGQGSMYASSQPDLAYKYGVIRSGKRVAAQELGQAPKGLRQETIEGLKALSEVQSKRAEAEGENARIEQEAAASPAGAAGRLGNAPKDGPQADPAATQENLKEAVKKLDDFDFNTFREMMMKDIINNDEQRQIIESRLAPMDLMDLVMKGFVTQKVPIVPSKLVPEFRSTTGSDDLAIKRLIMEESKGLEVSERYLLDKFSFMSLTLGLFSINNNPLPDHHDKDDKFSEEAFWRKFDFITKYPFHMLASLGVNYFWFDIRVRKLFVAEKLGNS